MEMEQHGYFTKIRGVQVYQEDYPCKRPNGKTVVLIHGYLSSLFSFRKLIPFLTESFRVLALDLHGFGRSEKSIRFTYSLENYARLIIDILKWHGLKRAVLCGHSMGGQIALRVALLAPDQVDGLILLASSGYLGRPSRRLVYLSYLPFFRWWLRRSFNEQRLIDTLKSVVYDAVQIDEQMIAGYQAPFLEKSIFSSLIRLLRHRDGDLTEEELKRVTVPVLLIWGVEDAILPLEVGRRLQRDIPRSQLVILKKTGHLVPEEAPEKVFWEIRRFAEKNQPR